jgi:hypothetical protein
MSQQERESAMKQAVKMAELDRQTNGHYVNAPYTIIAEDGTYLKARMRHSDAKGERIVRLELYQPETYILGHELSREKLS